MNDLPHFYDAGPTEGRSLSGSRRSAWVRKSLVVAQAASSLVLLVAAGLFARSFESAAAADVGFEARDRLTLSVNLGLYGYDDAQGRIYFESLRERVLTAPGVHSAAWSWQRPPRTWRRDRRSTRRSWTSTSRAQSTRDHH